MFLIFFIAPRNVVTGGCKSATRFRSLAGSRPLVKPGRNYEVIRPYRTEGTPGIVRAWLPRNGVLRCSSSVSVSLEVVEEATRPRARFARDSHRTLSI